MVQRDTISLYRSNVGVLCVCQIPYMTATFFLVYKDHVSLYTCKCVHVFVYAVLVVCVLWLYGICFSLHVWSFCVCFVCARVCVFVFVLYVCLCVCVCVCACVCVTWYTVCVSLCIVCLYLYRVCICTCMCVWYACMYVTVQVKHFCGNSFCMLNFLVLFNFR